MSVIEILTGPPASGKTMYARERQEQGWAAVGSIQEAIRFAEKGVSVVVDTEGHSDQIVIKHCKFDRGTG